MSAIPPSHIYTDTQAWDCHAKKLLPTPLRLQRYCFFSDYTSFWTINLQISKICNGFETKMQKVDVF